MQTLTDILDSIPTNDCQDRLQAKDDLRYSLSMNSETALRNFLSIWVLTTGYEEDILDPSDMRYRHYLIEFQEKYNAN